MRFLGGTGALSRLCSYVPQPYKATPKDGKRDLFIFLSWILNKL